MTAKMTYKQTAESKPRSFRHLSLLCASPINDGGRVPFARGSRCQCHRWHCERNGALSASEVRLSSSTPGWQGCTPTCNVVDLVRDALPLLAKAAHFPIVTRSAEGGVLSCRTAACK